MSEHNIKLAAIDMDGTLLNSRKEKADAAFPHNPFYLPSIPTFRLNPT